MSYGLAAYPGDPCYDSGRPSMLPYWLDDFTESDCKYNATNIAGATLNAFGDPGQVASNVVTPSKLLSVIRFAQVGVTFPIKFSCQCEYGE